MVRSCVYNCSTAQQSCIMDSVVNESTTTGLSTAGNKNSEEPTPINVDTPVGSYCENYPWSDRGLQTLNSHLEYHIQMTEFINTTIRDGPFMEMPKPPKPSLKSVLVKLKPKQVLYGAELHKYLLEHVVDKSPINIDPWTEPKDLDSVKTYLQTCFKNIKQQHAKMFVYFICFGKVLNNAFDYFSVCKLKGNLEPPHLTWAEWLKDNVGISRSYSKQLRTVAKDFGVYNRLCGLGISFSEFMKRKENIRLMFAEFPELDKYWRESSQTGVSEGSNCHSNDG